MNHGNQLRLWTVNFAKVMMLVCFMGISHQMIMTGLPMFVRNLAAKESIAGLVTGMFTLAALLFRPFSGILTDHLSRKKLICLGIVGIGICCFLYSGITVIWVVLTFRFLQGGAFSFYSTASATLVSDLVPKEKLQEGIGFYGIANSFAQAIAPGLGIWLIETVGFAWMFRFSSLMTLLALLTTMTISLPKQEIKKHKKKSKISSLMALLAITMCLVAVAQGTISSFLPAFAMAKGIGNYSLYFTFNAAFLLLSRLFGPKLANKFGNKKLITFGMLLLVSALFLIFAVSNQAMLYIAGCLYGLGYGFVQPSINVLMLWAVSDEDRGSANALFYCSIDAGYGIGSILCGFIAQQYEIQSIYLIAAITVFVVTFFFYFVVARQIKKS